MERLEALRQHLKNENLPAILVTNPVNVAYLSGFTGTAGVLLITEKQAYLLTDFRYLEQAGQQAAGFTVVDAAGDIWEKAAKTLGDVPALAVESDHLTVDTYGKLAQAFGKTQLKAIISPLRCLRQIKSAQEIRAIKTAAALADQAFVHILPLIKPGVRERDLALELEFFMRRQSAEGLAFPIIVASGYRSAMPHGTASDKVIAEGEAVVLDFGCIVDGYCSDMTRTVFVGKVTARQRTVYEAVLAAQKTALAYLQPGISGRQADSLARDVLKEYGLAEYFGHGLGHGVGREVHEEPRLSPLSDDMLQSGMVVTVEPGVYLQQEFGVRIEDLVVITDDGICNLTAGSKELLCL